MSPATPAAGAIPAFLVTGVCEQAMSATTMGLQWDLPAPVVVTHGVDLAQQRLRRTVSDITGVLERDEVDLAHACVHCAIREDLIPTLARLADLGRWESVIASLPVGADAMQVCRVAAWEPQRLAGLRIGGVVAALDGCSLRDDLTGDDLLVERGLAVFEGDQRGVAEVAASLVEYADLTTIDVGGHGVVERACLDLVRTLARPGALVVTDWPGFDGRQLAVGIHDADASEEWVAGVRRSPAGQPAGDGVWTLELTSDRPLHPQRMQERLETLGAAPLRSRGCFWLPTRPSDVCVWDGAGGQLSIGVGGQWGAREAQMTRIVVTGLHDDGDCRAELRAAFHEALVTDAEIGHRGRHWEVGADGLEPWLGDIRGVA